jgi:hypothetical protein
LEKLGEGDAGEVFQVETLLDGRPAILKRPRKSALSSEFMRQSRQIRTEGSLLKALQGVLPDGRGTIIATPELLDQSPPEVGFGEGFFVIIERAPGYDLKTLRQVVYFGLLDEVGASSADGPRSSSRRCRVQQLLVLVIRMLFAFCLLDAIHNGEV